MKNRRGEIATILTIGTLVIIGATAVVSSLGLNKQKSTSARATCASTTCAGSGTSCLPIGSVSNGLKCCAAHLGQTDHSWATWNTTCKTAVNTPIPTLTSSPGCKYPPYSCTGTIGTQGNCCAGYVCYGSSESTKKCTTQTATPVPTITPVPTQAGCKTPPMICSDPIGTQGSCCAGYTCYGAGPGFPSRCTAPANTPIPSTTPNPLSSCSKGGQPIIGTGGYNQQTCETICGAQNGTYVGPNQQWQEGTQRGCCCAVGNSNPSAVCPQLGLGYACCVQDNRCDGGTNRYQWYGCTGQVCSATKIVTQGGPGHLIDCPYGVTKSNPTSCEAQNIPPPAGCTDNGSYGLLGGCKEKCTAVGYECKAADGDASGEKRFCCPTTPTIDPSAPSERNAPCVAAYGASSYCSTNHVCNDPANEEYAPDGGSVICQDTTTTMMNQRCCKPKGGPTTQCVKHGCKDLSPDFSTLKSYYQKGTEYFAGCSTTSAKYESIDAVMLYCSEGMTSLFDNQCREKLNDPNAQCVLNPFGIILGGNYEKTDVECGGVLHRHCYQKKDGMDYSKKMCSSINPDYDTNKYVYTQDGKYYHKEGSAYVEYGADELNMFCSKSMFTPFDNVCIEALKDPTAQCVLNPVGWVAGGGYEKTTVRCGPLNTRYCYKKKQAAVVPPVAAGPVAVPVEEAAPVFETPTDTVAQCENIVSDNTGTYCMTQDADGGLIYVPFDP